MEIQRTWVVIRRTVRRSQHLQLAVMVGFWVLGEALARLLQLPLPGGIVGMALVLMLLATRSISLFSVRRGANWLIAEMLLFFVPAVMVLLDHRELLSLIGIKLLLIILISTASVMLGTALTIEFFHLRSTRHELA